MSDKLLSEQRAKHKLPGLYAGLDDVLQHKKILEAAPPSDAALAEARRISGVKVQHADDGSFTATASDLEGSKRLAHLFDEQRRLKRDRSDHVKSGQERVDVVGANGRVAKIHALNEADFGAHDAIRPARGAVTFTRGLPRCGGRNASDAVHEYHRGRCVWCGSER